MHAHNKICLGFSPTINVKKKEHEKVTICGIFAIAHTHWTTCKTYEWNCKKRVWVENAISLKGFSNCRKRISLLVKKVMWMYTFIGIQYTVELV